MQHRLINCLLPILFWLGTPSIAADTPVTAELIVPGSIKIRSIDGQRQGYKLRLRSDTEQSIALSPGKRELVVQYTTLFDISSDEHEIIKSPPRSLSFVAQAGASYRIQHQQPPQSAYNVDIIKQFAATVEIDIVQIQPAAGPASTSATIAATSPAATDPANSSAQTRPDALPMLQYWWDQATAAEQQQFLDWQAEQAK